MEKEGNSSTCNFLDLPNEVLVHIFSFTTPSTLLSCERVCNSFHDSASSEHVWKVRSSFLTFIESVCERKLLQAIHLKHFGGKRKKKGGKANKDVGAVHTWREHCIRAARTLKRTPKSGILNWACVCGHHVVLDQFLRSFFLHLHHLLPINNSEEKKIRRSRS